MSKRLRVLLAKGFFPKELPTPFTTVSFAKAIHTNLGTLAPEFLKPASSKCVSYNLARVGVLRRELRVPNPIGYFRLSKEIVDNWTKLAAHCEKSPISLTKPRFSFLKDRAIEGIKRQRDLPAYRARFRASGRYLLVADVARCYPSTYTHSIPWAYHGKAKAKKHFSKTFLGNRLDIAVRNLQDRQTIGLPIGPDAAFLLSELVLTAIDKRLSKKLFKDGYRYIDDFEFSFSNRSDAERGLGELQQALGEFELELNGLKTHITELPQPTDKLWATELRLFDFSAKNDRTAQFKLMRYFDRAFELSRGARDDYILNYAVARLGTETFSKKPWLVLRDLLLQSAIAEPSTLNRVTAELLKYATQGYKVDKLRLSDCLHQVIERHASLGHHSEIAWVIWAAILFKIKLAGSAPKVISAQSNSIVALLALDARQRGLLPSSLPTKTWQTYLTQADLYGEQWLLAYEANRKGWLTASTDYVAADKCFSVLKKEKVYFYDEKASDKTLALVKKMKKPLVWLPTYT